jgi:hypothetical protein
MPLDLTGKAWGRKVIPKFTDAELADAIETYETALADPNLDPNPDVYRGLIREWEQRHGLAEKPRYEI